MSSNFNQLGAGYTLKCACLARKTVLNTCFRVWMVLHAAPLHSTGHCLIFVIDRLPVYVTLQCPTWKVWLPHHVQHVGLVVIMVDDDSGLQQAGF